MALLLGKLFETPNDPLLVLARIAAGIVFFAYMELRKYLAGPGGSGFTVTMQSFTQM
jgi:hypothetical protein